MLKTTKRFVAVIVAVMMLVLCVPSVLAATVNSEIVNLEFSATVPTEVTAGAGSTVLTTSLKDGSTSDYYLSVTGNVARISFTPATENAKYCIYEADFMQPTKTNGIRFLLIGDSASFSKRTGYIYTNGDNITFHYGTGTVNVVSSYSANTWYNFKVFVDYQTGTQDVYVNGKKVDAASGKPLYTTGIKNTDVAICEIQHASCYDNIRVQAFTNKNAALAVMNAQSYISENDLDSNIITEINGQINACKAVAEEDTSTSAEIEAAATKLNNHISILENPNPFTSLFNDDFSSDKAYTADTGSYMTGDEVYKLTNASAQRLLYSGTASDYNSGIVVTEAEFNKSDYARVDYIVGMQNANGSAMVCRIEAKEKDKNLYFTYTDENSVSQSVCIAENYTTGDWHKIKIEANMTNRILKVYYDENRVAIDKVMKFSSTIGDVGRPFNSQIIAKSGEMLDAEYFIDNINIYKINPEALAELSYNDQKNVKENLTLPTQTVVGSNVTWLSSDTNTVSNSGTVTRQSDSPVKYVLMTAAWTRGGYTLSRDFVVEVIGTDKLYITDTGFEKENSAIYSFSNGDVVTFKVDVNNTATQIQNIVGVIALYNKASDKLEAVALSEKRQIDTGEDEVVATLTVPATGEYYIKGFVWNCFGSMIPYAASSPIGMAE